MFTLASILGIAENNPEEGSVALNKQRDRIETTNAIKRATELADNGESRMCGYPALF